jgi:hypothetical protein
VVSPTLHKEAALETNEKIFLFEVILRSYGNAFIRISFK